MITGWIAALVLIFTGHLVWSLALILILLAIERWYSH